MAANAMSMVPLSSLVYQSRAVSPLSDAELERLMAAAQSRNRTEGVTGLLVYDQGRFLQWLEGPPEGLGRIWQSIREDRRHTAVALVGQSTIPMRLFGRSPMALGKRRGDGLVQGKCRSVVDLPSELIETLYQSPPVAPSMLAQLAQPPEDTAQHPRARANTGAMTLLDVVDQVIIPKLRDRHARACPPQELIDPRAAELARLLLAAEPGAAFDLIDALRADGRSITQLCAGLFEPAARAMGDLWQSDDCSDFEVALGLGHLQVALRRASFETPSVDVPRLPPSVPHAVLVAPTPHEPHLLGSAIAAEMFWRAGWDVYCEFPDSDAALNRLVHDHWFDVLDLSLSGAFTREHRLPALAASVRAAHAHSLNPALTVIVDGRVFHERPHAGAEVGALASTGAQGLVARAVAGSGLGKQAPEPGRAQPGTR
jgi:hypothetical protein